MLGDHIRALKGGHWLHGIDLGDQRILFLDESPGLPPADRLRRVYRPEFTAGTSRVETVVHREPAYPAKSVVDRAWSRFMDPTALAALVTSQQFAEWCKVGRTPAAPVGAPAAAAPGLAVAPAAPAVKAAPPPPAAAAKPKATAKAPAVNLKPAAKPTAPKSSPVAKKPAPKKPAVKKPALKKAPAKKAPVQKAPTKKPAARKAPAKKAAPKKAAPKSKKARR